MATSRNLLSFIFAAVTAVSSAAQTSPAGPAPTPASPAPASPVPASQSTAAQAGGWDAVEQLHPGEFIRVGLWASGETCSFVTADDSNLICEIQRTVFFIPSRRRLLFHKSEVKTVRMSQVLKSGLAGGVLGAAAGAGLGAAIDAQAGNQAEEGHLFTVLFAMTFGGWGLSWGAHTDFLAGPPIYRRP